MGLVANTTGLRQELRDVLTNSESRGHGTKDADWSKLLTSLRSEILMELRPMLRQLLKEHAREADFPMLLEAVQRIHSHQRVHMDSGELLNSIRAIHKEHVTDPAELAVQFEAKLRSHLNSNELLNGIRAIHKEHVIDPAEFAAQLEADLQ